MASTKNNKALTSTVHLSTRAPGKIPTKSKLSRAVESLSQKLDQLDYLIRDTQKCLNRLEGVTTRPQRSKSTVYPNGVRRARPSNLKIKLPPAYRTGLWPSMLIKHGSEGDVGCILGRIDKKDP